MQSGTIASPNMARPAKHAASHSARPKRRFVPLAGRGPNNSFKPNLLRYGKSVAEKACHAFASTTQVGLTQALGLLGEQCRVLSQWMMLSELQGKSLPERLTPILAVG